MVWLAYAGFTGAVVFSILLLAWTIGVPSEAMVQLAVTTTAVMLGCGMVMNLCIVALRRRR